MVLPKEIGDRQSDYSFTEEGSFLHQKKNFMNIVLQRRIFTHNTEVIILKKNLFQNKFSSFKISRIYQYAVP